MENTSQKELLAKQKRLLYTKHALIHLLEREEFFFFLQCFSQATATQVFSLCKMSADFYAEIPNRYFEDKS